MTSFGEKSEYADVLARVRDWAQAYGEPFDVWRVRWDLQRETPGSIGPGNQMAQLYCVQVLRAINQLTDEGILESDGNRGRYMHWARPVVWARLRAEAGQSEAARAARQELREQRALRFAELGWDVTVSPEDGSVIFTEAEALRLLGSLQWQEPS